MKINPPASVRAAGENRFKNTGMLTGKVSI